jgi:hypothetical protein
MRKHTGQRLAQQTNQHRKVDSNGRKVVSMQEIHERRMTCQITKGDWAPGAEISVRVRKDQESTKTDRSVARASREGE